MTTADILRYRLLNQQIVDAAFKQPADVVSHLGAMQAQEYPMAKWAIGLRLDEFKEPMIEQAFNDGTILRTHLLRPTRHFVTPADVGWMLALTAPRVHAINSFTYRKFELDAKLFRRSNAVLVKQLRDGNQLTRTALKESLGKAKIMADGIRLAAIMMYADLEGIICSGARTGKRFTYALLEERVPPVKTLSRQEALIMLTHRYFSSRSPATIQDYVTWSGLTMKDAGLGLESLSTSFYRENFGGREYIFEPREVKIKNPQRSTFLMPDYNEYGMGSKDRSVLFNPAFGSVGNDYSHWIIINGQIGGTWKTTTKNKIAAVETEFFNPIKRSTKMLVDDAVKRFIDFTGQIDN